MSTLHLAIEFAVAGTLLEFKNLQDKDIEWVYDLLRKYFIAWRQGRNPAEPTSTRKDRMALIDMIWEGLVSWENSPEPDKLTDGSFQPAGRPISTVEELYILAFNDLEKSCRLRRLQEGQRGYVKFVQAFVREALSQYEEAPEWLLPPEEEDGLIDVEYLEEKRGIKLNFSKALTGIAAIDDFIMSPDERSPEEFAALVQQYPNEVYLVIEQAIHLDSIAEEGDRSHFDALLKAFPNHPGAQSIFLLDLIVTDFDAFLAEAQRIGFDPDLKNYPPERDGHFHLATLMRHSNVAVAWAAGSGKADYAVELLEDLLSAGLPESSLDSHGEAFFLAYTANKPLNDDTLFASYQTISENYEQSLHAVALLTKVWGTFMEKYAEVLEEAHAASIFPDVEAGRWPRNPDSVDQAFQLRVHIIDSEPEIFRTIVVPDDTLLPDLHAMLQVAFDWEDCHLHEFIHRGTHYMAPDPENEETVVEYNAVRVGQLLTKVGDQLVYHYDFGDGWKHLIVLEAIPPVDDEILYPRCIAGARRGPQEDSGGIHHYQHVLKVLKDPRHPEFSEYEEWLPDDFDPDDFDLARTHKELWKGRFFWKDVLE